MGARSSFDRSARVRPPPKGGLSPRQRALAWTLLVACLVVFVAFAWASDRITLKGQRTIYTARCDRSWTEDKCTGRLLAADRYRFHALKAQGEVLYWTISSSAPSGTLTRCRVVDGRNWACEADRGPGAAIVRELRQGRPY